MTNDGQNQYLYDGEGRVCAIKNMIGKMMQYLYDAEGTRIAKGTITTFSCNTASNGFQITNSYILTPGNQQLTELTWSGNTPQWTHTNVWAAGQLLATYSADPNPTQNVAGILNFYIDDPLGTRRVMTDYAGNTAETCHSLPFGNGEDCAATPAEHLFTQHERDAETGNDSFGARYYASSMGRFLTPDWSAKVEPVPYSKLDDPQTLNLYAYVGNNPFNRIDPDGHGCAMGSGGSSFACAAEFAESNAESADFIGESEGQHEFIESHTDANGLGDLDWGDGGGPQPGPVSNDGVPHLTATQQAAIKNAANGLIGAPYVRGGCSRKATDCSGAVIAAYAAAGIKLHGKRTTDRLVSGDVPNSPQFKKIETPELGDVGWYPGHLVIYGGAAVGGSCRGQTCDVWSATHPGGKPFERANSSWFGKPVWYRYVGQ